MCCYNLLCFIRWVQVAALCREKMHVLVREEFSRVVGTRQETESGGGGSSTADEVKVEEEAVWRRVMRRSFERMDEVALSTCACGSVGGQCGCHPMEVALGGSTAVVAVLTPDHIIVANCGDSRAVLCRGGRAIPLSNDHKVYSLSHSIFLSRNCYCNDLFARHVLYCQFLTR